MHKRLMGVSLPNQCPIGVHQGYPGRGADVHVEKGMQEGLEDGSKGDAVENGLGPGQVLNGAQTCNQIF